MLTDHRPGVRQRGLPIQRSRDHPRAEGVPARRDPATVDQHQPGQFDGPAFRSSFGRRVLAAQGRPPARQEHGRGDRHRPSRHAQHVRRGPDRLRRQGARRGARDRRSTRVAHRADPGRALSNDLQARRESAGSSSSSPGPTASRSWARPSSPSTTRRSSTSPAARTSRRSRRSSGAGRDTTIRRPNPASTAGSTTSRSRTRSSCRILVHSVEAARTGSQT